MSLTAGAGSLVFIPVIVYVLTDKELFPTRAFLHPMSCPAVTYRSEDKRPSTGGKTHEKTSVIRSSSWC